MILSQIMDPKKFMKLSETDLKKLQVVLQAELLKDKGKMKELSAIVDRFTGK